LFKKEPPKDSDKLIYEGIVFSHENNFHKAISCFDKALHVNPSSLIALSKKGSTLYRLERFEDALQCFDEVLKIDPKYIDALYNKS